MSLSLVLGDYKIELKNKLGAGSYSNVHLAYHIPSGNRVAVKGIDSSNPKKRERALNECQILRKLGRHENIIDVYDIIEDRGYIYIFLEYAPNGNLGAYIHRHGRLEEDDARKFFIQALNAVEYCHQNNISHHDVKLENFLLSSDFTLRLVDFDLSRNISDDALIKQYSGSPLYMPPEVFSLEPHTKMVDIWSLGICLYYMVTDTFPFNADSYHELEEKVLFDEVSFPNNMDLSNDLKDLIKKMLTKDPTKRITIDEIKNHNWILLNQPRQSSLSDDDSFKDIKFDGDLVSL